MYDAVDNGLRLLTGGGVIQINQRFAADFFGQDREIGANFFYGEVCHGFICSDVDVLLIL
jgi:hypothetical protein